MPLSPKRPHAELLEGSTDRRPSIPRKKYCPEAVSSFVTQWVDSTSSEFYQEIHCRSESLLVTPAIPTQSVGTFDATSSANGSGQSSERSLVEPDSYRDVHLAENNIYLRSRCEQLPEQINSLVDHLSKGRDSTGPSADSLRQDEELVALGMGSKSDAEHYFRTNIFPDPKPSDSLERIDRHPMARYTIPDIGSNLKVSGPIPDMLYGYNRLRAFPQQQAQFRSMGNEMIGNTQDLVYQFFVIEFKADGPGGGGNQWVATKQCLGGSTSCVNIAERLNSQLRKCKNKVQLICSAAFSITVSGMEARLYISWKHDEVDYYMQNIRNFSLQEPETHIAFRKYVRNIIGWGKYQRLKEIRDSLDNLLEGLPVPLI